MSEPTQKFQIGDSALYLHCGLVNSVQILLVTPIRAWSNGIPVRELPIIRYVYRISLMQDGWDHDGHVSCPMEVRGEVLYRNFSEIAEVYSNV